MSKENQNSKQKVSFFFSTSQYSLKYARRDMYYFSGELFLGVDCAVPARSCKMDLLLCVDSVFD